jgi:excisionase family DNA binding protein
MNELRVNVDLPEEVLLKIERRISDTLDRVLASRTSDILRKPKKLTRKETAQKLKISLPTLSKHERTGLLKSERIGRRVLFSEDDIEAYLKGSSASRNY